MMFSGQILLILPSLIQEELLFLFFKSILNLKSLLYAAAGMKLEISETSSDPDTDAKEPLLLKNKHKGKRTANIIMVSITLIGGLHCELATYL